MSYDSHIYLGEDFDDFKASFTDVHGRRLTLMDQNGIDFVSTNLLREYH